ncbi:MAG: hypothetical protein LBT42_03730 [Tannerella sp.]|jgi:hypothetical protein|nr:hypothetical protein [Tannerella sp.]
MKRVFLGMTLIAALSLSAGAYADDGKTKKKDVKKTEQPAPAKEAKEAKSCCMDAADAKADAKAGEKSCCQGEKKEGEQKACCAAKSEADKK